MSAELYLLDWQETAYGQQPKPSEVYQWLLAQGFIVESQPKVYANGTVQVECEPDPQASWPQFAPPDSPELALAAAVHDVVAVRKELLAIPESQRTTLQRGLLATMALMLRGYGVDPDAG